MSLLEKAIQLAVKAHSGQVDKVGQPYILHPLRVMFRLANEIEMTVAVLHDVIEDTEYSFQDLKAMGFSDVIMEALDCVTRRKTSLMRILSSGRKRMRLHTKSNAPICWTTWIFQG